jgi:HAD superfamily hydrolase (TIGR01509 family)
MGALAVGRVNAAVLDAVTVDAHGTLLALRDPVPALQAALAARGVERDAEAVHAGFLAEAAYYAPRAGDGHDEESLARLQRDCVGVFLEAAEADLDLDEFTPVYVGSLRFDVLPGVVESLDRLQALGLALAVVANWDLTLHRLLDELRLAHYFASIVPAARKPAPDGLLRALARLGVYSGRTLHVGDDGADEAAARAAGLEFAYTPLSSAVAGLG